MNATLDTAPPRVVGFAPVGIGRAHAKAILFGEHAVVYGAPALAVPVPGLNTTVRAVRARGVHLESDLYTGPAAGAPTRLRPVLTAIHAAFDHLRSLGRDDLPGVRLRIRSDIPPDRGLGSSAAVAAAIAEAVAGAFGTSLGSEARFEIAQEAERSAHGNPSGLDARTVLTHAPIRFEGGRVSPLSIGADLSFVLADSGVPGSTATAVTGVRAMHETDLGTAGRIVSRLGALAEEGERALREGDAATLGEGMSAAHEELRALGVSIPELNTLVAAAHHAGALGAKLTGGGLGGCILALAPSADAANDLARNLRAAGAPSVWQVDVNTSP